MAESMRTVELNNGVVMPTLGYGCAFGDWVGASERQGFLPEQAWHAVRSALDAGYRSFDGAHAYGTERAVGTLLGQRFAEGTLTRADVFLTTKLAHPTAPPHVNISHLRTWNASEIEDPAGRLRDDLMRSLDDLGVGYADLVLLHWPGDFGDRDPHRAASIRWALWSELMDLHDKGAARAIGVSNFTAAHLDDILRHDPRVLPALNQVECHPYCRDAELESACRSAGIVLGAYAPFASGAFGLLEDPVLVRLAAKHEVTPAQVVLRWHLQHGRVVLPKTQTPRRMVENQDLFGFSLDAGDMADIDALGQDQPARRTCPSPYDVA